MDHTEVKSLDEWLTHINSDSAQANQIFEDSLEKFEGELSVQPPAHLREAVLSKIEELAKKSGNRQKLDPQNLPNISASSNWMDWEEFVKDIPIPDDFNGGYIQSLFQDSEREISLAWMTGSAEEEGHLDLRESFLILDGSCECKIIDPDGEEHTVYLYAGDYLEIPLGVYHTMTVRSNTPIKAILQRLMIAA